jgi:hypothetical protein
VQKKKGAKQHLDPVDLPDGTYPAILSNEIYAKVLERVEIAAKKSIRHSRCPEMFLLRSGLARCAYCNYAMATRSYVDHYGKTRYMYYCANYFKCQAFNVSAEKLDSAVWDMFIQLADHVALLEESIELAMKHCSIDNDLRATEATLADWQAKVTNYEEDLKDSGLRGDTRAGIRNLLNTAYAMVEQLEKDRAELIMFTIDRNKERQDYECVLEWCKKVKSERGELSYTEKRDFLRMLGTTVRVNRLSKRGAQPIWDIRVSLPAIQEIIYQASVPTIGSDTLTISTL